MSNYEGDLQIAENKKAKRLRQQATANSKRQATEARTSIKPIPKPKPGFRPQPTIQSTPANREQPGPCDESSSAATAEAPRKPKISPIVLRRKESYNQIIAHLKATGVDFGRAVNVSEGMKLRPVTPQDYRTIQAFLDKNREPYHSRSHGTPTI